MAARHRSSPKVYKSTSSFTICTVCKSSMDQMSWSSSRKDGNVEAGKMGTLRPRWEYLHDKNDAAVSEGATERGTAIGRVSAVDVET